MFIGEIIKFEDMCTYYEHIFNNMVHTWSFYFFECDDIPQWYHVVNTYIASGYIM